MSETGSTRLLVVNADDFGFTRDVNAGIIEAHRNGILTAATLMADGAAFDDAVRLARQTPSLDLGVHLVVERAALWRPARIPGELRRQIEKVLEAGITPSHLDTHKHRHLLPWILEPMARLAGEYRIRWIRRPCDSPFAAPGRIPWSKRAANRIMRVATFRLGGVLRRHECRATDHFAGFQLTGRLRTMELVALIAGLPPGITELMTHPGRCTEELRAAPTRLKESREEELRALTSPEARSAVQSHGIRLLSYRDI